MRREDAPEAILAWDTETNGVSPDESRILTCYALLQDIKGNKLDEWSWIINPGVEVPKGASDVNGLTTEYIQEHGRWDHATAILEIENTLNMAATKGYPIVAYNQPFDLTLLDRELMRIQGHSEGVKWTVDNGLFFDPMVFDKHIHRFRKGSRKLMDVARHYGIEVDDSRLHEAQYDVELTAKLTWVLFQHHCDWTIEELQPILKEAKREQSESLQAYFKKSGKTNNDGSPIVIETGFPYNSRLPW